MPNTGMTPDERQALITSIRDFAARHDYSSLSFDSDDVDALKQLYRTFGDLGWIGIAFPEQYGGSGGSTTDVLTLVEELSYARIPTSGLMVSMIAGKMIEGFGSETQKRELIGSICEGNVISIGMSEPGAGSDLAALSCAAELKDGQYVINGQKTWNSAGHYATRTVLACRTSKGGRKHDGISLIEVPLDLPGIELSSIDTLGGRDVNDIFFTGAAVPESNVIGREGEGWQQLMAGLGFERSAGSAAFLGHMRRVFDDTLTYVKEREQFGHPIFDFQTINHRLADMATEIEACRLMTYNLAHLVDTEPDRSLATEASMTKLKTSETLKHIALEGMQMTGGMGYATEFPMEAHLRHAMIATVYAGASEVQRDIIAKGLHPTIERR
jgi:alkylation response protein AidB-like acyl-CoA dehydrogenase